MGMPTMRGGGGVHESAGFEAGDVGSHQGRPARTIEVYVGDLKLVHIGYAIRLPCGLHICALNSETRTMVGSKKGLLSL